MCFKCGKIIHEPKKAPVPVSYNQAIDAIYLAQRELREFYLPSQSVALTTLNELIKRHEEIQRTK